MHFDNKIAYRSKKKENVLNFPKCAENLIFFINENNRLRKKCKKSQKK